MELKDTIQLMTSSDYKERFKAEYDQLNIRTARLKYQLDEYHAGRLHFLPDTPIVLLEQQYHIMMAYKCLLIKRSQIERIMLDELD